MFLLQLGAKQSSVRFTGNNGFNELKWQQDGRLAPAYFSPEHKYFDQHLQTVKNETTV